MPEGEQLGPESPVVPCNLYSAVPKARLLSARLADRQPTFLANSESLQLNPRQGVLNGTQELTIIFFKPDVHGGVGFTDSQIEQIPMPFAGSGNGSHRIPISREFFLFCKQEILVVKKFTCCHDCDPLSGDAYD